MSTTIESDVVSMSFDNADFEKGVQESLSTLDKLKENLNMDKSLGGFAELGSAIKSVDVSQLDNGVSVLKEKFTALEIAGITAVSNLANTAIEAGKRMFNEVVIAPKTQGFSEYELKMGSVQTIMASSKADLPTVNKYLEELNVYADRTIYSFADMTSSIGKFTNAGVDLDTAVKAIQGISNEAALSGANANEASRAMYNFSQALSTGSVKLIDWKSIENANMATVEFKEQLLETAAQMGTVTKTADGMYQAVTKNAQGSSMKETMSATTRFNDSLSYQWMTADVLTTTLAKYADESTDLGKRAYAAAQDVKTFSQMMDTLGEATGSGWAQTFELVFGDFEESKQLWTNINNVLSDFISRSADKRNDMLKDWKELGGREKVVEGLTNVLNFLHTVITSVSDSFRKVFPPKTGKLLAAISDGFAKLTKPLKLSDKQISNLQEKLTAFFSIIKKVTDFLGSIGKVIITVFGGVFFILKKVFDFVSSNVIKAINKLTDSAGALFEKLTGKTFSKFVDDVVSKIKELSEKGLGKLDDVLTFLGAIPSKIDNFVKSVTGHNIGEIFQSIADGIGSAIDKIKSVFGGFKKVDTEPVGEFASDAESKLTPLQKVVEKLKSVFESISNFVSGKFSVVIEFFKSKWESFKTWISGLGKDLPTFEEIVDGVFTIINKVIESVTSFFNGIDFNQFGDIGNTVGDLAGGGIMAMIAAGVKKLSDVLGIFKKGSGEFEGLDGLLGPITEVLDGIRGCFEAWQSKIKADAIFEIAKAIVLVAASVLVLALVPKEKLSQGLSAITALFGELFVLFQNTLESKKMPSADTLGQVSKVVAMFAALMVSLSLSIALLSILNPKKLLTTSAILVVIMGVMTGIIKSLSDNAKENKNVTKAAASLLIMALAIQMLTVPLMLISLLNPEKAYAALGVIVLLLAAMTGVVFALTKMNGEEITKAAGQLILMAIAVDLMTIPIKALSKIEGDALLNAVEALAAVSLLIVGFMVVMGALASSEKIDNSKIKSLATAVLEISVALLVISKAIESLSGIEDTGKLYASVGALSIMIAVIAASLGVLTAVVQNGNFLEAATAMLAVAASLLLITGALALMTLIVGNENFLTAAIALGAALVVLGASVALAGLGGLQGGAGLILAAMALNMLIPPILILGSINQDVIYAGLIALGVALAGLVAVGFLASLAAPGLLALSTAIISIGAGVALAGLGLVLLAAGLSGIIALGAALGVTIDALLPKIVGIIPSIIENIANGIVLACKVIADSSDQIAKSVIKVLGSIIELLKELIGPVLDIIIEVLDALVLKLPDIFAKLTEIINELIAFLVETVTEALVTLFTSIGDNIMPVVEAFNYMVAKLVAAIVEGIPDLIMQIIVEVKAAWQRVIEESKAVFGINSPSTVFADLGHNIVEGLINGIKDFFGSLWETIKEMGAKAISFFTETIPEWIEKGKEAVSNLIDGIGQKFGDIKDKVSSLISTAKEAITNKIEEWKAAGKDVIDGLINGIASKAKEIAENAKQIASDALTAVKNFLGIKSPSRKFAEVGEFMDLGLIKGMKKLAGKVSATAEDVGKTSLTTMQNTISRLSDAVVNGIDDPVIKPVLDLTDVENGLNGIDDILNRESYAFNAASYRKASRIAMDMTDIRSDQQSEAPANNGNIYQFTQNNYSPKALSKIDIYRQTRNQFSRITKGGALG